MATASLVGHIVAWNGSNWVYADTGDIIPDSWFDRCTRDVWGDKCPIDIWRPCKKCGEYPNREGDDFCLGHLGKVLNACCGHGKDEGYIMFENGITIRGKFEIENWDKKKWRDSNNEYI